MDSSSAVALAALVVSVPSALVTIWYSHKQTQAAARANALTEQVRREQAEPFVIADIRPRIPGSSLLIFVIENIGPTLARDVQLFVDPPLQTTLGAEKEAILNQAVNRKISALPPGRRLPFVMDIGHGLFSSNLPLLYTVKVEATGPFGVMEPFTYVIDLAAMRDTGLETDSIEWSTHVIAE
jgi:hypothetical protein